MWHVSLQSWLLDSRCLVCYEVLLAVVVTGFTSPSSVLRLGALPLLVACTWLTITNSLEQTQTALWANMLSGHACAFLLQYVEVAILRKWNFEAGGPENVTARDPRSSKVKGRFHATNDAWMKRLRFGFLTEFSFRGSGTPYEVKSVPQFSFKDPQYVPTRTVFLKRTSLQVLCCYLIIEVFNLANESPDNVKLFTTQNIPFLTRLREVTSQELLIRLFSTVGVWISIYCILNVLQGVSSIVAVGSGVNSVKSWRPLFGPINEAYTVRRFWGVFWHQLFRQKLSGPASFITKDILRLTKGTLAFRYSNIFLVFLLSGLVHSAQDVATGMPWQASGAVRFFCTQAIGIILEDGVQSIFRNWYNNHKKFKHQVRFLGYIWVGAFFVWSTPAWTYPQASRRKGGEGNEMLPFSIIKPLTKYMVGREK